MWLAVATAMAQGAEPAAAGPPAETVIEDPATIDRIVADLGAVRVVVTAQEKLFDYLGAEPPGPVHDGLAEAAEVLELFLDEEVSLQADWPILLRMLLDPEQRATARRIAKGMVMGTRPLLAPAAALPGRTPEALYLKGRLAAQEIDQRITILVTHQDPDTGIKFYTLSNGRLRYRAVTDAAGTELDASHIQALIDGEGKELKPDRTPGRKSLPARFDIDALTAATERYNAWFAANVGLDSTRAREIDSANPALTWTTILPACPGPISMWAPERYFSDPMSGFGQICLGVATPQRRRIAEDGGEEP